MATVTINRQNLTGNQVVWDSLISSASLNSGASATSNDVLTQVPETCVVLASITSTQSATLKVSVHAGTADFSSPTATYTLLTTVLGAVVVNTSTTNPYISVKITAGSASTVIDNLTVIPLAKMSTGESWHEATSAVMAVASTHTGDGSGTFSIATS